MHILELGCHNQPTEISPGEDSDLPFFFFFLDQRYFAAREAFAGTKGLSPYT